MTVMTETAAPGTGQAAYNNPQTTLSPTNPITLAEIVKLDPRIKSIIREAGRPTEYCDVCRLGLHRQRGFKQRIAELVGFRCDHPDPRMRTRQAYDSVFDAVYRALPVAWHCLDCGEVNEPPSSPDELLTFFSEAHDAELSPLRIEYHRRAAAAAAEGDDAGLGFWDDFCSEVQEEIERRLWRKNRGIERRTVRTGRGAV